MRGGLSPESRFEAADSRRLNITPSAAAASRISFPVCAQCHRPCPMKERKGLQSNPVAVSFCHGGGKPCSRAEGPGCSWSEAANNFLLRRGCWGCRLAVNHLRAACPLRSGAHFAHQGVLPRACARTLGRSAASNSRAGCDGRKPGRGVESIRQLFVTWCRGQKRAQSRADCVFRRPDDGASAPSTVSAVRDGSRRCTLGPFVLAPAASVAAT